jgi:hypothetical protein
MSTKENTCYICTEIINEENNILYCNCKGSLKYHEDCMIKSINFCKDDTCRVCNYKFKYKKNTIINNIANILKEILLDIKNFILSSFSLGISTWYFGFMVLNYMVLISDFDKYNIFEKFGILNLLLFFEIVFIVNLGLYLTICYHFVNGWYNSIKWRINKKKLIKKE